MFGAFQSCIEDFLKTPKGYAIVEDIVVRNKSIVAFNVDDLLEWNKDVADDLLNHADSIDIVHKAIESAIITANMNNPKKFELTIVGKCIPIIKIFDIDVSRFKKIFKISGMITQASGLEPKYTEIVFRCLSCGELSPPEPQIADSGIIKPVGKCPNCNNSHPRWNPVYNLSHYVDYQHFTLQESYKNLSGRTPRLIQCNIYKRCLMNMINCGDECEIVGIVRVEGKKVEEPSFSLEILSINKLTKDPALIEITPEEESMFRTMSKEPDIFQKLIKSISPTLCGLEDEKEAVLLALFGSSSIYRLGSFRRGNIHILLVGDYGTGKTQLLKFAEGVSPRAVYAVAMGASTVGLTASVQKNNDRWELSAGAVVLADEGVACIDEIEKMEDSDKVIFHEVMESQTVTIQKATIHATLPAKTSIIAAANPISGKYDREQSVMENIKNIPPTIMDRFDLILITLRQYSIEHIKEIAHSILLGNDDASVIPIETFKKYIAYSKRINPKPSPEAINAIEAYYMDVFQKATPDPNKYMPIGPRQLESIYRATCAHARALLKDVADVSDFEAIKPLFDDFLKDVIGYDIDLLCQGVPTSIADISREIIQTIKTEGPLSFSEIKDIFQERYRGAMKVHDIERAWEHALKGNAIYEEGSQTLSGDKKYEAI